MQIYAKIIRFLAFVGGNTQQKIPVKNGPTNFKGVGVSLNIAILKKPDIYDGAIFYFFNIYVNLGMDTAPIIKPEWVPSAYTEKEETTHKSPAPANTPQPAIRQLTEKVVRKGSGLRKRR
jgi:hypothetical protein